MPEPLAPQENHTLAGRLIGALPAQYLALVVVNVVMIGGFFFYEDKVADRRQVVIARVMDVCVNRGNELSDLAKEQAALRALVNSLEQRAGTFATQMAGIAAKLDSIDAASHAELRGARKAGGR